MVYAKIFGALRVNLIWLRWSFLFWTVDTLYCVVVFGMATVIILVMLSTHVGYIENKSILSLLINLQF